MNSNIKAIPYSDTFWNMTDSTFLGVESMKPVCNDHLCNKILFLVIYSEMRFNEDWIYQLTLANNFCLQELS